MTTLSLLVVNYNSWRECAQALRSFFEHRPTHPDGEPMECQVIVVDNASPRRAPRLEEEVLALCESNGGRLILHHENGGYSKGINLALADARGDWILVSNPDVVFTPGCIDALLRHMEENPSTGCAVPKGFWDRDLTGRLPPNILPTLANLVWSQLAEYSIWVRRRYDQRLLAAAREVWEAEEPMALDMMSGCLFLIRRDILAAIGGLLDERYPLYFEDADLSVRLAKSPWQLVQVPQAHLVHLYNRSGQTDIGLITERNRISRRLFFRKWYGWPGLWILDGLLRLRASRLGRRLAARVPLEPFADLGRSAAPPILHLSRPCQRFMVQMSMDARFCLAGVMYGSGASWTPSDAMFENFGSTTYFFRAFDISQGRCEPVGRWRYTCAKAGMEPVPLVEGEEVR